MSLFVDIEKNLGDFHLTASFEQDNETLALLGPSGCGKSVTLKCIAGIMKPDRGRIVLNDRVLYDSEKDINLPPQKRNVGYLFQQYALFPNMTVRQNIAVAMRGRPKDEIKREVARQISLMKLEGYENHKPREISGGQQQRVALARIMASRPDLLLLDEPFSALDSALKYHMENEVCKVIKDFGKGVILVSHDRGEAYRISDRIAAMSAGKLDAVKAKEDWLLESGSCVVKTNAIPQNVIIIPENGCGGDENEAY